MPDDTQTRNQPPSGLRPSFERIAGWLDGLRKVVVAIAVTAAGIIVVAAIVRELAIGGIVIEPVVIKASDGVDAPTPEVAAQQIARHLDRIQRAGAQEWRKAHVDDSIHSIDLQIPGSPLSLGGVAREVVALFGGAPVTVRSALARRPPPAGYSAVTGIAGDPGSMADCPPEREHTLDTLDAVFECIALSAITFHDPKVAASYVFQRERAECKALDTGVVSEMADLQREEQRIQNRRKSCSFDDTQKLLAKVLDSGRKTDRPWALYIYGQVHMARSAALAGLGLQQQLSELDQAIARFREFQKLMSMSPTAIAILMEAYLDKGIAIHQSTPRLGWSDDPASLLQWRLKLAEQTFAEADAQLNTIPARRSASLDALVGRLEGLLLYRQWMVAAHRRTKSGVLAVATGQPAELEQLTKATAKFEAADAKTPTSAASLVDWGNVVRAAGKYEEAAALYRRAVDLNANSETAVNIVVAYLDQVIAGPQPADQGQLLKALGALSDYLAWTSGGGPYDQLIPKTKRALAQTGDADEVPTFETCLNKALAVENSSDPKIGRWQLAASLKLCVDGAIDRVNARSVGAAAKP
jgi:tetratricopeptide (TPR) repeat protein